MATAKKTKEGTWRCLAYVGKDVNKSGYKSFTAKTKKEAERLALAYEKARAVEKCSLTVGQMIDAYIASKSNILSPTTIRGYRNMRKVRMQTLMHIPADRLEPRMVQQAFNTEAAETTPKSQRNAYSLFSAALRMHGIEPPKVTLSQKERHEKEILTTQQVQQLLQVTAGDFRLAILLAAEMGFTRSEICALTSADCKNNKISINKALVLDDKKQWVVKVPKEYARYRTLDMTMAVQKEFSEHTYAEGQRIIALSPDVIGNRFSRITLELFGKRFGFHSLRHYNVSMMLAAGIPPKYIIDRTGHSTMHMVDTVYGHTMQQQQNVFAQKFNEFMQNTTEDTTGK